MTEEAKARRRKLDHERYLRNREKRLEYQRTYYKEHRKELLAKKREKAICKPVYGFKARTRADIYHEWYLRHREAHIAKMIKRHKEKKNLSEKE